MPAAPAVHIVVKHATQPSEARCSTATLDPTPYERSPRWTRHVRERSLLVRLPTLEVGLLNKPGCLHLRQEEAAQQVRVESLAPATFDDALQQFPLALGVSDGLAGIPLPPRDLVHQRQPLPHEAQQTVEGCQVAPR